MTSTPNNTHLMNKECGTTKALLRRWSWQVGVSLATFAGFCFTANNFLIQGNNLIQRPFLKIAIANTTGCPKWAETWVWLTLISVFHHLVRQPSRFCQIPISPNSVRQTVEHSKSKSTKPSLSSLWTTPWPVLTGMNIPHSILPSTPSRCCWWGRYFRWLLSGLWPSWRA